MGLFGKKKEEEFEDDEEFEAQAQDDFENRKLKKQLRDLKSENRKTRQEPPKPWGKKERLIVLTTLLVTLIISGILFLISSGFTLPSFPGFSFDFSKLDFDSFNIFKEQTIEIRKK